MRGKGVREGGRGEGEGGREGEGREIQNTMYNLNTSSIWDLCAEHDIYTVSFCAYN